MYPDSTVTLRSSCRIENEIRAALQGKYCSICLFMNTVAVIWVILSRSDSCYVTVLEKIACRTHYKLEPHLLYIRLEKVRNAVYNVKNLMLQQALAVNKSSSRSSRTRCERSRLTWIVLFDYQFLTYISFSLAVQGKKKASSAIVSNWSSICSSPNDFSAEAGS